MPPVRRAAHRLFGGDAKKARYLAIIAARLASARRRSVRRTCPCPPASQSRTPRLGEVAGARGRSRVRETPHRSNAGPATPGPAARSKLQQPGNRADKAPALPKLLLTRTGPREAPLAGPTHETNAGRSG